MVRDITKKKKGVFYTITSLLLMAVFLFGFLSITKYRYSTKAMVIETRVNTINDFVIDVERDIQRALYITSYRAILSMTEMITKNQTFVDDVELRFEELFFNGTYDGEETNFIINNTFQLWEDRIKQKAQDLDINIELNNKTTSIRQDDPWNVKTQLDFTLKAGDIKGTANFTKKYTITAYVPIEYFEDPTYRINTNGLVIKPIRIQNDTNFVEGTDVTHLEEHSIQTRYIAFEGAPSYLKRLEGDLTADENGIESLVNIAEFIVKGAEVNQKSIVDYIYFSEDNPASYQISGLDNWFRIDNTTAGNTSHLQLYEAEGLI